MTETVESRAVTIAARVMQAAGLCLYASPEECRRPYVDASVCDGCIRNWLMDKAREALEGEGMQDGTADAPIAVFRHRRA